MKYDTEISFIICAFLGLIGGLIIIDSLGYKIYFAIAFFVIGMVGMFNCLDFWINVKKRVLLIQKEIEKGEML